MQKANYFRAWKLDKVFGWEFIGKANTYEEAINMGADDVDYIDSERKVHIVINGKPSLMPIRN